MSDISTRMLQAQHKGVHEQFDMLMAAMTVQVIANSSFAKAALAIKSQKETEKWLREQLDIAMTDLGHKPGFMMRPLLVYVFQLFERFYSSYTSALRFKPDTSIEEIHSSILMLAAAFLDRQFSRERRADVCTFLKQDVRSALAP
jgi:hypothetical protein